MVLINRTVQVLNCKHGFSLVLHNDTYCFKSGLELTSRQDVLSEEEGHGGDAKPEHEPPQCNSIHKAGPPPSTTQISSATLTGASWLHHIITFEKDWLEFSTIYLQYIRFRVTYLDSKKTNHSTSHCHICSCCGI